MDSVASTGGASRRLLPSSRQYFHFIFVSTFVSSMKTLLFSLLSFALVNVSCRGQELAELIQPPDSDNQKAEVSQWVGPVKITVVYHSPRVHFHGAERTGRIWGELIPFGFVDDGNGSTQPHPWRAGANETTTISFSGDVKVQGKDLKAGTYGLFLVLDKAAPWQWILSSEATGWGAYQYDPKDEVVRVPASPQDAPFTEFLTYGFDERLPGSAEAFLQWENKRVPLKIDVPDTNEVYLTRMRQQLRSWPGFNYQNYQLAAQFCADHKINLEEGLIWADRAIKEPFRGGGGGREDFTTLQTKAAVLDAMGKAGEADALMDKAVRLPGNDPFQVHQYAMRLLRAARKERAMDTFELNFELHPDEKFITFAGLARGYTALGDKENAIKNWEAALQRLPETQKKNRSVYEKALSDLRQQQ